MGREQLTKLLSCKHVLLFKKKKTLKTELQTQRQRLEKQKPKAGVYGASMDQEDLSRHRELFRP